MILPLSLSLSARQRGLLLKGLSGLWAEGFLDRLAAPQR